MIRMNIHAEAAASAYDHQKGYSVIPKLLELFPLGHKLDECDDFCFSLSIDHGKSATLILSSDLEDGKNLVAEANVMYLACEEAGIGGAKLNTLIRAHATGGGMNASRPDGTVEDDYTGTRLPLRTQPLSQFKNSNLVTTEEDELGGHLIISKGPGLIGIVSVHCEVGFDMLLSFKIGDNVYALGVTLDDLVPIVDKAEESEELIELRNRLDIPAKEELTVNDIVAFFSDKDVLFHTAKGGMHKDIEFNAVTLKPIVSKSTSDKEVVNKEGGLDNILLGTYGISQLKKMSNNADTSFDNIVKPIKENNDCVTSVLVNSAEVVTDLLKPIDNEKCLIVMGNGAVYAIDENVPGKLRGTFDILINIRQELSGSGVVVLTGKHLEGLRELPVAMQYSALAYISIKSSKDVSSSIKREYLKELGLGTIVSSGDLKAIHKLICEYAESEYMMHILLADENYVVVSNDSVPSVLGHSLKINIAKLGIHEAFCKVQRTLGFNWED